MQKYNHDMCVQTSGLELQAAQKLLESKHFCGILAEKIEK